MKELETLRADLVATFAEAERLITTSWTKGAFARLATGKECNPLEPEAVYFSLSGALESATRDVPVVRALAFYALSQEAVGLSMLWKKSPGKAVPGFAEMLEIQRWQDEPVRTNADARRVLRFASLRLQGVNDLPPQPLGQIEFEPLPILDAWPSERLFFTTMAFVSSRSRLPFSMLWASIV